MRTSLRELVKLSLPARQSTATFFRWQIQTGPFYFPKGIAGFTGSFPVFCGKRGRVCFLLVLEGLYSHNAPEIWFADCSEGGTA